MEKWWENDDANFGVSYFQTTNRLIHKFWRIVTENRTQDVRAGWKVRGKILTQSQCQLCWPSFSRPAWGNLHHLALLPLIAFKAWSWSDSSPKSTPWMVHHRRCIPHIRMCPPLPNSSHASPCDGLLSSISLLSMTCGISMKLVSAPTGTVQLQCVPSPPRAGFADKADSGLPDLLPLGFFDFAPPKGLKRPLGGDVPLRRRW